VGSKTFGEGDSLAGALMISEKFSTRSVRTPACGSNLGFAAESSVRWELCFPFCTCQFCAQKQSHGAAAIVATQDRRSVEVLA
jgi:hypothetical protein